MSSMDVYLMKNVGYFFDVFEWFVLWYLEKGDNIFVFVIGEYYVSKRYFLGFGWFYVFNVEFMFKVGVFIYYNLISDSVICFGFFLIIDGMIVVNLLICVIDLY